MQAKMHCSWIQKPDVLAPDRLSTSRRCCQPGVQVPDADEILQMVPAHASATSDCVFIQAPWHHQLMQPVGIVIHNLDTVHAGVMK